MLAYIAMVMTSNRMICRGIGTSESSNLEGSSRNGSDRLHERILQANVRRAIDTTDLVVFGQYFVV